MYRLFYDYHTIGDVLMIVFNNQKKADRIDKKGNTVAIYSHDELIGVNLFDISNIVRIKAQGMIHNPAPAFIEVINHVLVNDGLSPLPLQTDSGFIVGQILEVIEEENATPIAKIDLGSRVIYVKALKPSLPVNRLVVIALPGTILGNGQTVLLEETSGVFCEGQLCRKSELNIPFEKDNDDIYFLEQFMEIGQDFFCKGVSYGTGNHP